VSIIQCNKYSAAHGYQRSLKACSVKVKHYWLIAMSHMANDGLMYVYLTIYDKENNSISNKVKGIP
jgi:hypothetical protein